MRRVLPYQLVGPIHVVSNIRPLKVIEKEYDTRQMLEYKRYWTQTVEWNHNKWLHNNSEFDKFTGTHKEFLRLNRSEHLQYYRQWLGRLARLLWLNIRGELSNRSIFTKPQAESLGITKPVQLAETQRLM